MERFVTDDIVEALYSSNCFEEEFSDEALYDAETAFIHLAVEDLSVVSFLAAHRMLMKDRYTIEPTETGAFRTEPCRVGLSLMPPADLVAEYTGMAIGLAEYRGPEQTGDFMAKLHPFADGNGRMARMVMYMMQKQAGEDLVPFEGRHGLNISRIYQDWLLGNYPQMKPGEDIYLASEKYAHWPWRKILDGELNG